MRPTTAEGPCCGALYERYLSRRSRPLQRKSLRDAVRTVLEPGDSVSAIKILRAEFSAAVVKVAIEGRSIRPVVGDAELDRKIDGIGATALKSDLVRRARCGVTQRRARYWKASGLQHRSVRESRRRLERCSN